ncbi:MAG: ribosome maturation factor RimP [Gammaproteobacteria bacterium AqS3]|nr:ribosome maturation factor RimP [Gammaproteobacteria bacterium AqS3]
MLEQRLQQLMTPTVEAMGYELWGIEHFSGQSLLRIYIDKRPGPLQISDCERVSDQISALLDVEDPLPDSYSLEVSSPGLDRRLFRAEHWRRYVGSQVAVRLHAHSSGRRRYEGTIASFEGDVVTLELPGDERIAFDLNQVYRAQLIYDLEQEEG